MDRRALTVCGLKQLESELQRAELLQWISFHAHPNLPRIKRILRTSKERLDESGLTNSL